MIGKVMLSMNYKRKKIEKRDDHEVVAEIGWRAKSLKKNFRT